MLNLSQQSVCLAHRGPGFDPQHFINCEWWYILVSPELEKLMQGDQKFIFLLNYTGDSRLTWDSRDAVSNKEKLNEKVKSTSTSSLISLLLYVGNTHYLLN